MATSDAQTSNRAIITVLGSDCPGIVAAVSGALSESLGVQITLQREDVFRYMYRL